ncbi:hypothetical protein PHLCEN_2v138 [Hermanssonia centrifuga]|uniref:Uncharacterized protein n=1 Tax=Hermanssonia centrifuga TaxID=98765 RepID=A0A2R6S727_9APHY|nr:hypothetical protein PHLCEN_2v138 [Hermanssonia centrifuga]
MALARTEVDELAASILEPSSVPRLRKYESPAGSSSVPPSRSPPSIEYDDLADVDADLQAALQASLMDRHTTDFALPDRGQSFSVPIASRSNVNGRFETPTQVDRGYGVLVESDDDEDMEEDFPQPPVIPPPGFAAPRVIPPPNFAVDDDPIAASRARGQAYMDQVRRQQEAALQNSYQEEIARMEAGVPTRRNTRQAEEDAELQRAIEASRALHEAQGSRSRVNDEDDESADDSDYVPSPQHITPPPSTAIYDSHRVYDDDDAELQAALKASLEDMPEGFRVPSTPPRPQPPSLAAAPEHLTVPVTPAGEDHDGSDIDTVSEAESSMVVEPPPELSMEEMRRRRLAKFGG